MDYDKRDWDFDILTDLFEHRDVNQVMSIPICNRYVEDKLIWRWEEKGCFSVKSCYHFLYGEMHNHQDLGWTRMWDYNIPPKIKMFFWRACSNVLPTAENLLVKHVNCSPVCAFC